MVKKLEECKKHRWIGLGSPSYICNKCGMNTIDINFSISRNAMIEKCKLIVATTLNLPKECEGEIIKEFNKLKEK